jgi:hypothetical protein
MKNIIAKIGILGMLSMVLIAHAKVVDPEPVIEGNVMYSSHANYVEAINIKTKETIWKTELYKDIQPDKPIKDLEEDTQWNIIRQIEMTGSILRAVDGRGKEYFLDKSNGLSLPTPKSAHSGS